MTKKQLISTWVMGMLIVIFFLLGVTNAGYHHKRSASKELSIFIGSDWQEVGIFIGFVLFLSFLSQRTLRGEVNIKQNIVGWVMGIAVFVIAWQYYPDCIPMTDLMMYPGKWTLALVSVFMIIIIGTRLMYILKD